MARGAREAVIRMGIDRAYLRSNMGGAERDINAFGRKVGADMKRTLSGALGGLSNMAGFLGVAGLASAANDVLKFEQRIHMLGVNASATATQLAKAKAQILATSKATGVDANALLGGLETLTDLTGNIEMSIGSIDALGRVARATGADMDDIANAAAALNINLGVTGPEMTKALGAFMAQAEIGAVGLKQMAGELARLTPQFAAFGDTGVDGAVRIGAALQILRNGFGTTAEAATGMQSLMTKIVARAEEIQAVGVSVFNPDTGKLRSFADIAFDLVEKIGDDPVKLLDTLKDKEAIMAINALAIGGREKYNRLVKEGSKGEQVAAKKFADAMNGPLAKIEVAKAKLFATFNEQLVKHLPTIVSAIEKLGTALAFMAEHSTEIIAIFAAIKAASMAQGLAGTVGELAGTLGAGGGRGGRGKRGLVATGAGYVMGGASQRMTRGQKLAAGAGAAASRAANAAAIASVAGLDGDQIRNSAILAAIPGAGPLLSSVYGGSSFVANNVDRGQDASILGDAGRAVAEQNVRRFRDQRVLTRGFDVFGSTFQMGTPLDTDNAARAALRAGEDAGLVRNGRAVALDEAYRSKYGNAAFEYNADTGQMQRKAGVVDPELEALIAGLTEAIAQLKGMTRPELILSPTPLFEAYFRGDDPSKRNGGM